MSKFNFSNIAQNYQKTANVQKSNADQLIKLLKIKNDDNILDVGCGPGHLSKNLRGLTQGKILAIDSSEGMIIEANKKYAQDEIEFKVQLAEDINNTNEFDIVFVSSALMWFKKPEKAILNFYYALRSGGKVGIQNPAKNNYCPMFIKAIEKVKNDKRTKDIFAHFKNPWFWLETADEYTQLFEKCHFRVISSEIIEFKTIKTAEEIYSIFSSGAIAGYLNQAFYDIPLPVKFVENFEIIVKKSFQDQCSVNGKRELMFHRIFLIAEKK